MPLSTGPVWLQADRRETKVIRLYTFLAHLLKMFKSFIAMPMHGKSCNQGIPRYDIS
jgi:hypothetical protein